LPLFAGIPYNRVLNLEEARMLDINPITNAIADIKVRLDALRGYL